MNENTGRVGQPIATTYGLIVKCLIHPAITLNCNLIIGKSSIVQTKINTGTLGTAFDQNDLLDRQRVHDVYLRWRHHGPRHGPNRRAGLAGMQLARDCRERGPLAAFPSGRPWIYELRLPHCRLGKCKIVWVGLKLSPW